MFNVGATFESAKEGKFPNKLLKFVNSVKDMSSMASQSSFPLSVYSMGRLTAAKEHAVSFSNEFKNKSSISIVVSMRIKG